MFLLNPLSANPTKWSNTLKQFVGNLPNCLSVFDHFVILALKGLRNMAEKTIKNSKKILHKALFLILGIKLLSYVDI